MRYSCLLLLPPCVDWYDVNRLLRFSSECWFSFHNLDYPYTDLVFNLCPGRQIFQMQACTCPGSCHLSGSNSPWREAIADAVLVEENSVIYRWSAIVVEE